MSGRYYDVLIEHGLEDPPTSESAPDVISVSPSAVIVIWRYKYPVTYSRDLGASINTDPNTATELRAKPLIIYEDIQSLSVTSTKSNHIMQLNATLLPGANYGTEIFPGDWCGAWIVNNDTALKDLLEKIKAGEQANEFLSGLKFLGRVTASRKRIVQHPDGVRATNYLLNAAGFQEFDASIYYEPYLASNSVGDATEILQKTGKRINELITQKGIISVNTALPFFLSVFYGSGVPKDQGFSDQTLTQTAGLDNPNAFVIPDPVAATLGVTSGSRVGGKKGFVDICNFLRGIQDYEKNVSITQTEGDGLTRGVIDVFLPDSIRMTAPVGGRDLPTSREMLGTFLPQVPQFNGQKTVWSIFQQFLNPTINELFTCLRVGPEGTIMPTLVARQLPFTTGILSSTFKPKPMEDAVAKIVTNPPQKGVVAPNPQNALESRNLNLTRFTTLPRWRIHPILIKEVDLGRSDALRFNFVHVYGETGLTGQNRSGYLVRDPPIRDDLDINRSGLRPYMATVNCSPQDAQNRLAGDWMYILSDILMGQHMTLTGNMTVVGIQAPICPGDNIEFDEHILHIESVTHNFNMVTTNGRKSFTTSLSLSHGIKAEQGTGRDMALFTGTSPTDLRKYEGSMSRDYSVNSEEPISPPDGALTDSQQSAINYILDH